MTLDRLFQDPEWTETRLAAAVGVNQSTINRLRKKKRKKKSMTAGLGLALRIERATEGAVRAEDVPMTKETRRDLRALRAAMRDGAASAA